MTTKLTPSAFEYARTLQAAGFTVYVSADGRTFGRTPQGWFHYSHVNKDGITCFGTFQIDYFGEAYHTMPVNPTREHGSAIVVGQGRRGVPPRDPWSVEAAVFTAQPQNAAKYIPGVSFHNHRPSSVTEPLPLYVPLAVD